jgi:kumamolisin
MRTPRAIRSLPHPIRCRLGTRNIARHRMGPRDGAKGPDHTGGGPFKFFCRSERRSDSGWQAGFSSRGGQVSNSWGSFVFPGEAFDDSIYVAPGVVFLASSGDVPGTEYPCVSPNIVCVGGTTVNRTNAGNYINQTAWASGGGGSSAFENRPAFQNVIAKIVGNTRGAPDVASVADPSTGVYVYVSNQGGWLIFGGTSVAAPVVAGITNFWGKFGRPFQSSSNAELTYIYKHPSLYSDVTLGGCGINNATKGWDFCTGWGWMKGPHGLGIQQ